jgi:hypothetical protein
MAGSFTVRQSKTILARSCEAGKEPQNNVRLGSNSGDSRLAAQIFTLEIRLGVGAQICESNTMFLVQTAGSRSLWF